MKAKNANPPLPLLFRIVTLVEAFVLAGAGGIPFLLPDLAIAGAPWALTPFNARFIGAVYLSSLAAILVLFLACRWAPARVGLPMVAGFTTLVLIVSILNAERFDFQKKLTWIWFVLYVALPVNAAYHLWRYYRLPPANAMPVPLLWRIYLLAQGVVLGLYGCGLLLFPTRFSAFWPWPIDVFHGQLYSAIFVTLALAAFVTFRVAAPAEFFLLGLTQTVLGCFAILGLVLVDAVRHRVQWGLPGVWLWIGAFAILAVTGMAMLWRSWVSRRSRAQPSVSYA